MAGRGLRRERVGDPGTAPAGQDHVFWQRGGPSLVSAARFPNTEATLTLSHSVPVN